MKKAILLVLITIVGVFAITGCGNKELINDNNVDNNNKQTEKETSKNNKEDNQELVDTLNNTVNELIKYTKSEENTYKVFRPDALYQIFDKMKENKISNYEFMASCDKEFKEKVELKEFAYTEDLIPNYDGKCTYSTWQSSNEKYNKGTDRYILVLDNNTNEYYSVKVSFKKMEFNNKNKYYPIFSNSTLLK